MSNKLGIDWDSLSFEELAALREDVMRTMRQRFERHFAMAFTDVVGSTEFYGAQGNVDGQALLRRHELLIKSALVGKQGRLVDMAGDGAFCVFETTRCGLSFLADLQNLIARDNADVSRNERLVVRSGLHWGAAFADGVRVRGDSVHLGARVGASAMGGEIRLSQSSFATLTPQERVRCRRLPEIELKGFIGPVQLLAYDWRDPRFFPSEVEIEENGEHIPLPLTDSIAFGRLALHEGKIANDIVLALDNAQRIRRIGRWHFALESSPDGFIVRQFSRAETIVDGIVIEKGSTVLLRPDSRVELSGVMTLQFCRKHDVEISAGTILNE